MQTITNIIIIIALPCIVYTVYDIHMWLTNKKRDRSNELIDIFMRRASKNYFNSEQVKKLCKILRASINEYISK